MEFDWLIESAFYVWDSTSECLPHVGRPVEVLLEDCLDVGEVGVIPDQVTQIETVDHPEIDLCVTDVDHLEILWKILAENDRTTHNLACHHHNVTYVHWKKNVLINMDKLHGTNLGSKNLREMLDNQGEQSLKN